MCVDNLCVRPISSQSPTVKPSNEVNVAQVATSPARSTSQQGVVPLAPVVLGGKEGALAGATVRWNELARDLVAQTKTAPPPASRGYAILSLAQAEALAQASARGLPAATVLAEASRVVLRALFPGESAAIDARAKAEAPSGGRSTPGSPAASARAAGRAIGEQILASRKDDGASAAIEAKLPTGPSYWHPEPGQTPAAPQWSAVKPFVIPGAGQKGRPSVPPPPAFGSREFQSALAEVRKISDTRTPEQLGRAMFWADNAGTSTPPGHWNQIASDLIKQSGKSDVEAAQILATMNVAVADAGIVCWETKYRDALCRPWQADPAIVVPADLGKPNHPSYVSGHASFSGAAAAVLGHYFPEKRAELWKMAEEAAWSRVEGGIHYGFDGTQGLSLGRQVADQVLAKRAS